jgi:hypothetical protein
MFSAVGQGSQNTPRLIEISYRPKKACGREGAAGFAASGKAITFDSGGLSLKSAENMADMKSDMAGERGGAGCAPGGGRARPTLPVLGYLGAAENMPSGTAYRPGDILVSRLGKTVEVTNTDAEGRLVLGDVLALRGGAEAGGAGRPGDAHRRLRGGAGATGWPGSSPTTMRWPTSSSPLQRRPVRRSGGCRWWISRRRRSARTSPT